MNFSSGNVRRTSAHFFHRALAFVLLTILAISPLQSLAQETDASTTTATTTATTTVIIATTTPDGIPILENIDTGEAPPITPPLERPTETEGEQAPAPSVPPAYEGLMSCVAGYPLNPLTVAVTPVSVSVPSGSSITFNGSLTNENPYPVPSVSVRAAIVRATESEAGAQAGSDIIAWLPIMSDVDLAAGEARAISIAWSVPESMASGTYEVVFEAIGTDRFLLSRGAAAATRFQVEGNTDETVGFDRREARIGGFVVLLNGTPFAVPAGTGDIPVEATIRNTTDSLRAGTVTWKLYRGNVAAEGMLLDESSVPFSVPPDSSNALTYTVANADHALYYLTAEFAENGGTTVSSVETRFTRSGVQEPLFDFVAGTLGSAGNAGSVIACVRAGAPGLSEGARLTLTARPSGPIHAFLSSLGLGRLAHATYEGAFPNEPYALEAALASRSTSYVIDATLWQDGTKVDEVSVPYCEEGTCSWVLSYIVTSIIIVLLIIAFFLIKRRVDRLHQEERRKNMHVIPRV